MTGPSAEKDAGIERRYHVAKTNDPTGKHDDCQYFVLDPQHDPFAVAALRAYAAQVGGELAEDIARWLRALGYCPNCSQVDGHRGSCATSADDPDPWRCTVCGSGREVHIVGERDGSVTHAWEPHLAQTGEAPMPDAEKDAGLTEAERKALAHAIEDDLHRLSALNETGAPSAHWFGWFLMNKGNQHLVPEIERIVAARTRVTSPGGSDA